MKYIFVFVFILLFMPSNACIAADVRADGLAIGSSKHTKIKKTVRFSPDALYDIPFWERTLGTEGVRLSSLDVFKKEFERALGEKLNVKAIFKTVEGSLEEELTFGSFMLRMKEVWEENYLSNTLKCREKLIRLKGKTLARSYLAYANISELDLRDLSVEDTNLSYVLANNTDFSRTRFRNVNMKGATLLDADALLTMWSRVNLQEASLKASCLRSIFMDVDMRRVCAQYCDFRFCLFPRADFTDSRIESSMLHMARFSRNSWIQFPEKDVPWKESGRNVVINTRLQAEK